MDFSKLKVVELKAELSERGLATTGRKDEMIARLTEFEQQQQATVISADEPSQSLTPSSIHSPQMAPVTSSAPVPSISPISEPTVAETHTAATQMHLLDEDAERLRQRALRFGIPVEQQVPPEEVLKQTLAKLDQPLRPHGHRSQYTGSRKHRPN
jgi:hypothetical protein